MALTVFPKHTGVWEGTYTRINAQGEVIDKHRSRLTLALNGREWTQTNEYIWDNGKREFHDFGVSYFDDNDRLQFDNHRIKGEAWESSNDIINLYWTYKEEPGTLLFEIITLLGDGHRMRTWQHSRNGKFEGLTMIEERRVA
ncbi:MAG: DUF3598 family protein [Bacteroidota bacterium]|nr:DUF3598 family protein [Candidatus Kapabacteria bacterium]MDW8219211.1 DUF3598 family protein [Bacteroidota bacterium]